ncbi:MAG TPA: hypothetical protein VG944_10780 [Fimbriimonas sp.]|nr:hypothetical protein [Fimbriimonas sp.]
MKKVLLILGPLLLLGGTAVGLAMAGIVDIPGLSPHDYGKKVVASKDPYGGFLASLTRTAQDTARVVQDQAKADAAKAASTPPPPPPKPKPDVEKGNEALAEVWNSVDPAALAKITEKWKPQDLAKVLLDMDTDKVSKFLSSLASLEPARAEALSRSIQTLAAEPPPVPAVDSASSS